MPLPTTADRRGERLLAWYDAHERPLPWRKDRDPYRRWVAEVLLQQTRVQQAIPYYTRFLEAFPTVRALAAAPLARVLKVWEGAGYYGRARRLHQAAGAVVAAGGRFPRSAAEWERLPGVGPYIARALASLLEGEPVLALEANGLRVAARWTREEGAIGSREVRARLEGALRSILPRDRPGAFNEALMELGETLCRPREVRCDACPAASWCHGFQELDDPTAIPRRAPRRERPHVIAAVGIVEHRGAWLVQPRPAAGLLGGLWEFPGGKVGLGESPREACARELLEETGLRVAGGRALGSVRHGYSHFTVELHAYHFPLGSGARPRVAPPARWLTPRAFALLPRPRATEKVVALLTKGAGQAPGPSHPLSASRGRASRG